MRRPPREHTLRIIENIRRQAHERFAPSAPIEEPSLDPLPEASLGERILGASPIPSSPSSASFLIHHSEDEEVIARRKERARLELEEKQREYSAARSQNEHVVMSLESLNVVGSSVSSLAELIRAKEEEIRLKKSANEARKSELAQKQKDALEKEMRIKQLEYLKQLEEEDMMVDEEMENIDKANSELECKISKQASIIEKLIAPHQDPITSSPSSVGGRGFSRSPLSSHASSSSPVTVVPVCVLNRPSPSASPALMTQQSFERKSTPEIFSIASPARIDDTDVLVQDLSPTGFGGASNNLTNLSPVSYEVGGMISLLPSPEMEMPMCDEISDLPDDVFETLGVGKFVLEPLLERSSSVHEEEQISLADSPYREDNGVVESNHDQVLSPQGVVVTSVVDLDGVDISPMASDNHEIISISKLSLSGFADTEDDISPVQAMPLPASADPGGPVGAAAAVVAAEFTLSTEEDRKGMDICEEETATTVPPSEIDELTDSILTSLMDSILTEHLVSRQPREAPRIPTRIDSFDLPLEESGTETRVHTLDPDMVIKHLVNSITEHVWVSLSDELTELAMKQLKILNYESILHNIPGIPPPVSACIADAFLVLIDSLPPALAAERDWQIRFPSGGSSSKNPMVPFLPSRHSLGSLMKELRGLIVDYNKSMDCVGEAATAHVETVLSREYLKKFRADEVLFQCNDSGLWMRFEGGPNAVTCTRAEAEIVDEVTVFVYEAILMSIANDFHAVGGDVPGACVGDVPGENKVLYN